MLPWLCPPGSPAQHYTFKYYGHAEGLTNLAIHCLLQDRTGFVWVGTANGLFRYDGRRFTAWRKAEGLPASRVESLHESADGTLWVATRTGLARRRGEGFVPVDLGGAELLGQIRHRLRFRRAHFRRHLARARGGTARMAPGGWRSAFTPIARRRTSRSSRVHAEPSGRVWFGCGSAPLPFRDGRVVDVQHPACRPIAGTISPPTDAAVCGSAVPAG